MIEFLQAIIRPIWELLLHIPMPWRVLAVSLVLTPVFSWLFWRAFPWLLAKLSHLLLIGAEFLVKILLLLENFLTQQIRKRGRQPPDFIYIFDDLLSVMMRIFHAVTQQLDKVLEYALKKQWIPRKRWFVIPLIVILPFIEPIRPILGESTVGKLETWWYSLEGWALTRRWALSALSFPPEQFVRDYYSTINNRQVPAAWNRLSPRFQKNTKLMQNGYSDYLDWWEKKVEQVNINQVTLVAKNNNSAIVEIKLQYFMRETQKLSSPESIRLFLVWDSPNSRWLIDEGKRLS
ncbi:MAG: hypothetical protein AB1589_29820 [Cyanobacteriota bacterium]